MNRARIALGIRYVALAWFLGLIAFREYLYWRYGYLLRLERQGGYMAAFVIVSLIVLLAAWASTPQPAARTSRFLIGALLVSAALLAASFVLPR